MEPRDRSAPMDIDPPVYNTDRLDAFVYKHNDGPARKRTLRPAKISQSPIADLRL